MKHTVTPHAKKIFLIALALNLLACALYAGIFTVANKKIKSAEAISVNVQAEKIKSEKIAVARASLLGTEEFEKKLTTYSVGSVEEQVDFLSYLEELGRTTGISVVIGDPKIVGADRFAMEISMTGSWDGVMRYFMMLETIPRYVTLKDPKFEVKNGGWGGTVHLEVYKRQETK